VQGVVRVDGLDLRGLTLDSLRSQIGVVLQDTVLFSGTVADNIAYGRPDATREQVLEAAVRANADGFIRELPEGYDTLLGERAANLSGGQRQRIAIARAFIRDAPILILDEPTTGLDASATEQVLLGLQSLMQGKTTVIITHNLNLIRSADRILVVDGGRIVEDGDHEGLLAAGGTYADYFEKQAGPARTDDAGPVAAVREATAPIDRDPDADAAGTVFVEGDSAPAVPAPVQYLAIPEDDDVPTDGLVDVIDKASDEAQLALVETMGGKIPVTSSTELSDVARIFDVLMRP
jgi:energy-coupling factor transporter ATP-binding protein EcfA2